VSPKKGVSLREKLIKSEKKIEMKLGDGDLILSVPEEEFLDRILWSIQEFLQLVS